MDKETPIVPTDYAVAEPRGMQSLDQDNGEMSSSENKTPIVPTDYAVAGPSGMQFQDQDNGEMSFSEFRTPTVRTDYAVAGPSGMQFQYQGNGGMSFSEYRSPKPECDQADSDAESELDSGEFGRSCKRRRTFSQCDSPTYPLPECQIYESDATAKEQLLATIIKFVKAYITFEVHQRERRSMETTPVLRAVQSDGDLRNMSHYTDTDHISSLLSGLRLKRSVSLGPLSATETNHRNKIRLCSLFHRLLTIQRDMSSCEAPTRLEADIDSEKTEMCCSVEIRTESESESESTSISIAEQTSEDSKSSLTERESCSVKKESEMSSSTENNPGRTVQSCSEDGLKFESSSDALDLEKPNLKNPKRPCSEENRKPNIYSEDDSTKPVKNPKKILREVILKKRKCTSKNNLVSGDDPTPGCSGEGLRAKSKSVVRNTSALEGRSSSENSEVSELTACCPPPYDSSHFESSESSCSSYIPLSSNSSEEEKESPLKESGIVRVPAKFPEFKTQESPNKSHQHFESSESSSSSYIPLSSNSSEKEEESPPKITAELPLKESGIVRVPAKFPELKTQESPNLPGTSKDGASACNSPRRPTDFKVRQRSESRYFSSASPTNHVLRPSQSLPNVSGPPMKNIVPRSVDFTSNNRTVVRSLFGGNFYPGFYTPQSGFSTYNRDLSPVVLKSESSGESQSSSEKSVPRAISKASCSKVCKQLFKSFSDKETNVTPTLQEHWSSEMIPDMSMARLSDDEPASCAREISQSSSPSSAAKSIPPKRKDSEENSSGTPVKKLRSSEVDPQERTSGTKIENEQSSGSTDFLKPPSVHNLRANPISPKRKVQNLECGGRVDDPESETLESASKKTKIRPPTPQKDESDVEEESERKRRTRRRTK